MRRSTIRSPYALTIATAGDFDIETSIQNAGSGAVTLVAGWDGHTLPQSSLTAAGVYGNGGHSLTIGGTGAAGNVAVGSSGGQTTIAADNVTMSGVNGSAQLGFNGTGNGAIAVDALGAIALDGGSTSADFAEIGNGTSISTNTGAGNVTLAANTITAQHTKRIVADALSITVTGAGSAIGSSAAPIGVTVNGLAISANGANAYIASPTQALTLGTTTGGDVDLGGGNLSIASSSNVAQTQKIAAGALSVTTTGGGISLTNALNDVTGTVMLSALADASFENSVAIALGTSNAADLTVTALGQGIAVDGPVEAGSSLTLQAQGQGDITEGASGSLAAQALSATSSNGGIALGNAANAVSGTTTLSAHNDATFENSTGVVLGASSARDLTITAGSGGIAINGAEQAGAALTLTAAGDITEGANGSVAAQTLTATSSTGGIALGNPANNVSGTTTLSAHNAATFENAGAITLGASNAGSLAATALHGGISLAGAVNAGSSANLQATGDIGETANGVLTTAALTANSSGGALALTNTANAISGTAQLSAAKDVALYDVSGLTLGSLAAGGNATVLSKGTIDVTGGVQLSSGALALVAGWDGQTTAAASFGNAGVYGNNAGGIVIGGNGATGGVAVGSNSGTTTVEGATVQLAAVNGYAMIGTHGAGSGAIAVNATGNITLSAGAGANDFAQIGNGGQGISGNDSGNITVATPGNVALNGGTGTEAYAQIGHGGAETNKASSGYSNTGTISVNAANATLAAGAGSGAYTQIGLGGFEAGEQLAGGTATNSGDVTVIVTHDVALNGNGNDAYAQVGNGGDKSNMGAAASAHGTNTGTITVTAPNGPTGSVTLTAGSGTDAYAEIGNGGFASNGLGQAVPANFTDSGNVSVTDLTLTGGDGGSFSYAQIGNGDASGHNVGDVSGNIAIDANGNIVFVPGTAPGSGSSIGNDTGSGTISGLVSGYIPPQNAALTGTVVSTNNSTKNNIDASSLYQPQTDTTPADTTVYSASFLTTSDKGDNVIAGDSGSDEQTPSDSLTVTVANSLTKSKGSNHQIVIIGLLTQVQTTTGKTPHGVPPADQEYSSWGNEALWQ